MKSIPAAKFKEQCLALLDHVDSEGIIITKHGKPVAKLVPIETDSAKLIGSFKGKIKIKGNILSTVGPLVRLTSNVIRQTRSSAPQALLISCLW
jgi:prevent-host-death family protein